LQKNRSQRKLPGGAPPVVTYSRHREEDLVDYDDGRAEPRFEDDAVAEWEAVEVPPEPPLHARRRVRPTVEDVRPLRDEADFEDRPAGKERPKRSTGMRLVAVAAVALVAIGIALIAYTFMSSTTVNTGAPALSEGGAAPGPLPAEDTANVTPVVREIPITNDGGAGNAAGARAAVPASAPAATAPAVAPPSPRARPEPPASAAAAVEPDFDQAAPLAPAPAPQAATAPADPSPDDAFISLIERTLAETGGGAPQPRMLSPATGPDVSAPRAQEPFPIPPENIPLSGGAGQPLTLPNDFLLLDE
jgi:hypothetical protein